MADKKEKQVEPKDNRKPCKACEGSGWSEVGEVICSECQGTGRKLAK